MLNTSLEIAIASSQIEATSELARSHNGRVYIDRRDNAKLPFRALATIVSDDLDALYPVADVGLYIIARRTIKPGSASVYGLFPMVGHPQLTHTQADAHWRDQHAPLALIHHAHMSHYEQLSVIKLIDGLALDGIALCGFNSEDDLRNRFFSEPDSSAVIANDVQKFADTKRSPRRLVATMEQFS